MGRPGRAGAALAISIARDVDLSPSLSTEAYSRQVARVLYGAVVGLALVVGLESHPPPAGVMVGTLLATALAVGAAEFYGEFIGRELRSRRLGLEWGTVRGILAGVGATMVGAGFPAVFFVLAALDVLSVPSAFDVAKWSGLGLIMGYGFLAGRVAGGTRRAAFLHAVIVGAIGGLLIAVKSLLH